MRAPLPWQYELWQPLQDIISGQRLPHAILLTGTKGLGKRLFAQELAQTLLCSQTHTDGSACQHCSSCRQFHAASHPDYQLIEPESGKPIGIDAVRQLSHFLTTSSHHGRHKIVLLDHAEQMTINAANSLLKTLEEPPAERLLLLSSAVPARLPATIRSRCQALRFKRPDRATARAWLQPQLPTETDVGLLLDLVQDAPLQALQTYDPEQLQRRTALFKTYSDVIQGRRTPAQVSTDWHKSKDFDLLLSWLISWLQDMIRLRASSSTPPPYLQNPDFATSLEQLASNLTLPKLLALLDMAQQLLNMTPNALNAQLQIEAVLLAHTTTIRSSARN